MNNTLVIFHRADLDGLCCEAIARKALGDRSDYLGFDYGDKVPDLAPYSTVYLLDISLPIEVMREHAAKLIVIDHHKTLISAVEGIAFKGSYLIDGVAACRLAWQCLINGDTGWTKADYVDRKVTEPYAVELLGEYDIWDKRDPSTDLFQLAMQAEKSPNWDLLLVIAPDHVVENRAYIVDLVERGRAIQSYTEVTNAQVSRERGFDVKWEGLLFRALNTARSNSLTFTAALRPEHDGCLSYFWNGRGWRFSLYHAPGKEHHNLSTISVKHGGGGHPGASGFELKRLPAEFGGV